MFPFDDVTMSYVEIILHYLNQWCHIFNNTQRNKFQKIFISNSKVFIQGNPLGNVEMSAILSRPQCLKSVLWPGFDFPLVFWSPCDEQPAVSMTYWSYDPIFRRFCGPTPQFIVSGFLKSNALQASSIKFELAVYNKHYRHYLWVGKNGIVPDNENRYGKVFYEWHTFSVALIYNLCWYIIQLHPLP